MANSTSKQILEEGPRNAVVKLAGVIDTSNLIWTPAVSLIDFLNNDQGIGKLWGLRIDEIQYSSGPGMITIVEWQSGTPQLIAAFSQSDELEMKDAGGLIPNRNISGFTGEINVRTAGYQPGTYQAFSLLLTMVKLYS